MIVFNHSKQLIYKNLPWTAVFKRCVNWQHGMRLCFSSLTGNGDGVFCVEQLKDRGLLQVSGDQVGQFMQGIITNDMKHLEEGSRSMFTMFLNSRGRVIYDAIIYKDFTKPAIYIECDKSAVGDLEKHLNMFKLRRKIGVNVIDNYKIWVMFCPKYMNEVSYQYDNIGVKDLSQEKVVPCQAIEPCPLITENSTIVDLFHGENLCVTTDPRLPALGVRILAEDTVDIKSIVQDNGFQIEESATTYKIFRYSFGIGEGLGELPYGKCFPLEMNCDYLHGVSFHKGCYIGQELTARTHHTGVVRKRLMPIKLDTAVENSHIFPFGVPIEVGDDKPRSVGKLCGIESDMAIGLVRISDALSAAKLKIGTLTGSVIKPQWWPQDAPKENIVNKNK